MPLPALQLLEQKLEQQKRLFELRRGALEKTIEQHIQLFEQRKGALEKKIEHQFETHKKKFEQKFDTQKKKIETRIRRFEQKNGIRLDDEVRFIRSWIEKPLTTGAVTPSGRALARTMASYVDPRRPGLATTGRRGGIGLAALHQATAHAPAAVVRSLRPDVAGRALRAVHLQRGCADPETARSRECASIRAGVDEYSARAGMGVSEGLTTDDGTWAYHVV